MLLRYSTYSPAPIRCSRLPHYDSCDGGTPSRDRADRRQHARREITIGPLTPFARETPDEVVRAPCMERGAKEG
ncbi:hypothetical protein BV511_04055 [Methylorubrum extorquens]|nr:hypothetical protein BV511_04055 [Methylorubrum extorquens]ARO54547.1 hypothetical protein B2G69_10530 [Methylorubrum zatmanii]